MVNFTPQPLYPQGKSSRYPLEIIIIIIIIIITIITTTTTTEEEETCDKR
jgi:hypothetical protein